MKKSGKKPGRLTNNIEYKKKSMNERPSLSYEDLPIDDYSEEPATKIEMPEPVLKIILILLACTISVLIWANWSNLSPDKVALWIQGTVLGIGGNAGFPNAIVGNEVKDGNFKLLYSDIASVSDTSFFVMNRSGKQVYNKQHSFGTPVLTTDGSLALLYNRGGKSLQIESASNEIYKTTYENNIQTADISNSGVYAVVTDSKNYLSEMTIYLKDNTEKYKYYFSECYVTCIDINSEGNLACVSGFFARDGAMRSVIYLFSFNSTEPLLKLEFDGMPIDIRFFTNNKLAFISDNALNIIDINSKSKKEINYNRRVLVSYDIEKNSKICLALSSSKDGRNCNLVSVDKSGNIDSEFNTEFKILSLSIKDNIIAILSPSVLNIYTTKGEILENKDVGSDAKEIVLYSKHDAYVLSVSDVRKISF